MDSEDFRVKKDNTWLFGAKTLIGVNQNNGLKHMVEVTGAGKRDVTMVPELLREEGKIVYGEGVHLGLDMK